MDTDYFSEDEIEGELQAVLQDFLDDSDDEPT